MSVFVRRIHVAWLIAGLALATSAASADTHAAKHHSRRAAKPPAAQAETAEHHRALDAVAKARMEPRDEPDGAARFFLTKRLAPGMTEYPTQQIIQAYQESLAMPLHSTVGGRTFSSADSVDSIDALEQLFWSPLGPGNVGGRTRVLRFLSGASQNMVTAGVAGGVWKTSNSGASWTATGDLMANLAVNSLIALIRSARA